jgi:hypothetical protein
VIQGLVSHMHLSRTKTDHTPHPTAWFSAWRLAERNVKLGIVIGKLTIDLAILSAHLILRERFSGKAKETHGCSWLDGLQ